MKLFPLSPRAIRWAYAVCMAGATLNHASAVAMHGLLWDYGGAPAFSAVFWTSLTFLDGLAVALLLLTVRIGVALTAAIIAVDVAHNTWFLIAITLPRSHDLSVSLLAAYFAQIGFFIFVALTLRRAWLARR